MSRFIVRGLLGSAAMKNLNLHILVLFLALTGACDTDTDAPPVTVAPLPMEEVVTADDCEAAEEYLISCGALDNGAFLNHCTPDLAAELLALDCGDLPD